MSGISGKGVSERESYWRSQMSSCAQSGLSIAAYCRRHKLPVWQYHWWKRELKRRDACGETLPFLEVGFRDALLETSLPVEVVLRGERRIMVRPGFDSATLAAVLQVLERTVC